MVDRLAIIEKTRLFMKEKKLNFLIVFSTDKYLNEYVDLNENARYMLTGFAGSTGDALVTPKEIFLFVDGRYHLQAEEETDRSLITVVKVGMDKSPQTALFEKITELSDHKARIGFVSKKMNCGGYRKLLGMLSDKNADFKEFDFDPVIEAAGAGKPEKPCHLRFVPQEISGMSAQEKLDLVIKNNKENNIDILVVTKLEEIAYLTNLRGDQIPYSSSFKAKAVIDSEKCHIFARGNHITQEIKENLGDRFVFCDGHFCENFLEEVEKLPKSINIGYDFHSMNLSDCKKLERMHHKLIDIKESYISLMKSVKNKQELEHIHDCFLKTDIVVNRAIIWLRQELEHGNNVSEKDFSDKVKKFFFEEGSLGLSFETIAASGSNSAFIHYTKANPEKFIKPDEMVLLDCGAYFEGGYATDITRTFFAGTKEHIASEKQKEIYTKVLRGFLHGINYEVTENTTGFDIDKKVREIIDEAKPKGFNFAHGTGHGVGISVHESPPRVSPAEASRTELAVGMCFTIEPGLYCDGWGGVRIENTVSLTEENGKPKIKTLTKARLDDNLIDRSLLTEQEKIWLENYQKHSIW